jgi:hypothetical protein
MSRIQIALIARYDAASSGPNRRDPAQAKTDQEPKPTLKIIRIA